MSKFDLGFCLKQLGHMVITAKEVEQKLGVTGPTAQKIIADFQKAGIVSEKTGMLRNRIFVFKKYTACFER